MTAQEIQAALAEPFQADEVEFKPQAVSGSRALAICYIDARAVMDRLDVVLGVGGWQTAYRELPDGVVCKLRVQIGDEWIEHEDVGSFSDQPDKGDRLKAAFSDALKRVAVHLGIGRYLYRIPNLWVDFDPQKKRFVKTPTLPAWALPAKKAARPVAQPTPTAEEKPAAAPPAKPKPGKDADPVTGAEFAQWLDRFDRALTNRDQCVRGDCIEHVRRTLVAMYGDSFSKWDTQAVSDGCATARKFAVEHPLPAKVAG